MRFQVTRTNGNPHIPDGCVGQQGSFRHRTQPGVVREMAWYVRDFKDLDALLAWADGLILSDSSAHAPYGVILGKNWQREHWDLVQGDEMPERTVEIWDDYH